MILLLCIVQLALSSHFDAIRRLASKAHGKTCISDFAQQIGKGKYHSFPKAGTNRGGHFNFGRARKGGPNRTLSNVCSTSDFDTVNAWITSELDCVDFDNMPSWCQCFDTLFASHPEIHTFNCVLEIGDTYMVSEYDKDCNDFTYYKSNSNNCVSGWTDSDGYGCSSYDNEDWCTSSGDYGSGWYYSYGTFEDWAYGGFNALEACEACGCHTSSQQAATCAPGCPSNWPGDGWCDSTCNNYECNYDDGDCSGGSDGLCSNSVVLEFAFALSQDQECETLNTEEQECACILAIADEDWNLVLGMTCLLSPNAEISVLSFYYYCSSLSTTSNGELINVNHIHDNPGFYTCDTVAPGDHCLTNGGCVETNNCPSMDGQPVVEQTVCPGTQISELAIAWSVVPECSLGTDPSDQESCDCIQATEDQYPGLMSEMHCYLEADDVKISEYESKYCKSDGLSTGAIIGIGAGGLAFVITVALVWWFAKSACQPNPAPPIPQKDVSNKKIQVPVVQTSPVVVASPPPPPAYEASLPPEWAEMEDGTGKKYFSNTKEQRTTWTDPRADI